jgi:hypothetical protein
VARKNSRTSDSAWPTVIRGFFEVMATAIDRFGWPGTMVALVFFFVEQNGSLEQKREFITLMLHPGASGSGSFLVLLAGGVLTFAAQHYVWKKRDAVKNDEIRRLSEWKTQHQQKQIPTKLHHSRKTITAQVTPKKTTRAKGVERS